MTVQPGETLTYRVRVRTKSAGQFTFRAELTGQNITKPIENEAMTEVF
jgi:acyl dehydratase